MTRTRQNVVFTLFFEKKIHQLLNLTLIQICCKLRTKLMYWSTEYPIFQSLTLRCWTDFSKKKWKDVLVNIPMWFSHYFFKKYINTLGSQRCCWAENRAITESECKLSKRPKLQRRKTLVIFSSGLWNLIKTFHQASVFKKQHNEIFTI